MTHMTHIPTVRLDQQVGWYSDGALYCLRHMPDPHPQIGIHVGVEPVLRADITPEDDYCDVCLELLDDSWLPVYDNFEDPMYTPDEHGAPDSLYFPLA